jgi:cystathionine gamma-lyase
MLKLCDIAGVAAAVKKTRPDLLVAVDNTFMTPYLQRPLELGADIVVHSTTKYLNGHSDVVGGAIICNDPQLAERLSYLQNALGGVPGPLDCFLVLRGTKTLALRMERHTQNATEIVAWLRERPEVERVIYPGKGGMVTFVLSDSGGNRGLEHAKRMLGATRLFACAESLGGVESLIEHPASMTHASIPQEVRENVGISDGLIRLSVGVEHVADLRADLEQGFAKAAAG